MDLGFLKPLHNSIMDLRLYSPNAVQVPLVATLAGLEQEYSQTGSLSRTNNTVKLLVGRSDVGGRISNKYCTPVPDAVRSTRDAALHYIKQVKPSLGPITPHDNPGVVLLKREALMRCFRTRREMHRLDYRAQIVADSRGVMLEHVNRPAPRSTRTKNLLRLESKERRETLRANEP